MGVEFIAGLHGWAKFVNARSFNIPLLFSCLVIIENLIIFIFYIIRIKIESITGTYREPRSLSNNSRIGLMVMRTKRYHRFMEHYIRT